MYDCEDNLRRIYFNVKILKKSENISNEKYNRAYRLYNNIFKINIERITKTKIINIILRNRINFIKRLFNILIR